MVISVAACYDLVPNGLLEKTQPANAAPALATSLPDAHAFANTMFCLEKVLRMSFRHQAARDSPGGMRTHMVNVATSKATIESTLRGNGISLTRMTHTHTHIHTHEKTHTHAQTNTVNKKRCTFA